MYSRRFPVDAVYMWADGQDPAWLQRRHEALLEENAGGGVPAPDAIAPALFRENDELRYALRSLERFAPWIRRVYLVVDKQRPAWINAEHLSIVEHKDILPEYARYPLFNSHGIELCLHRIPGVAEHFLAFNDDFMLGAPVRGRDFFSADGKPRVWLHTKKDRPDPPGPNGSLRRRFEMHTREIIRETYGVYYPHKVKHYPRAYTRSSMEALWEALPREITATLQSRFRSADDFMTPLGYALFLIATGRGEQVGINGIHHVKDFFIRRVRHIGASLGDANARWKMRLITLFRPLTFCINDSPSASEDDRKMLRGFLETMFPRPSRFEKTGP